jgi:hypothetical protein
VVRNKTQRKEESTPAHIQAPTQHREEEEEADGDSTERQNNSARNTANGAIDLAPKHARFTELKRGAVKRKREEGGGRRRGGKEGRTKGGTETQITVELIIQKATTETMPVYRRTENGAIKVRQKHTHTRAHTHTQKEKEKGKQRRRM